MIDSLQHVQHGERCLESPAAPLTVVLPADFGIEGAAALRALLVPHVHAEHAIELDAPSASRVHTAALQVLAAFVRTRAAAGRATVWREPPAALRAGAMRLGLDAVLGFTALPESRS